MIQNLRRSVDDGITEPRESLVVTGVLVVSLFGFVPVVALVGRETGVGLLPSLLAALAVVGLGYATFVYLRRQLIAGAYLSFAVLSTFAADLPVGASAELIRVAPGSLGPRLWLFQGPLLLIFGYLLWTRGFGVDSISRVELTFGAFVLWTLVSAFLGAGPRTDVALYFTLLMAQAWVGLAVFRRGVESGLVSLESVLTAYIVTLVGHLAFGATQLANDGPIGLLFLGEGVTWHPPISYIVGGQHQIIPTGFTGHGYVLVAQILLTFPTILWFVYRSDSPRGTAAFGAVLLSAVFLRITTSDAGRGAFLVLAVCLAVGVVLLTTVLRGRGLSLHSLRSRITDLGSPAVRSCLGLLIGVLVVLSPSSMSGTTGEIPDEGNSTSPETTPADATPATEPLETPSGQNVTEISIPLFDLTNLGTRVQQIVVGLEVFVRNPLFGVGGGNYRFVAATYGLPNEPGLPVPPTLHNVYALLLAETGLPGFLLYFGTIGLVASSGLKYILRGDRPYMMLSVLVSFVAYFAFLFFSHLIDNVNALLPFWALAGAIVGTHPTDRTGTTEGNGT